ncbi:hypothetical protein ABZV64_25350 [Streptomyces sp. NPDC004959]|nr:hypothetical protein [Streptomyces sp. NRRL F-5630]
MSVLLDKVNAGVGQASDVQIAPVMATPAAFVAGVVAGGKVCAVLTAAAGVGAAVKSAQK